jgi:hypothetical protein
VNGDRTKFLAPDRPAAVDKQLELVLPVKMRQQVVVRWLLDQKRGGRQGGIVAAFHPFGLEEGLPHHLDGATPACAVRLGANDNHDATPFIDSMRQTSRGGRRGNLVAGAKRTGALNTTSQTWSTRRIDAVSSK